MGAVVTLVLGVNTRRPAMLRPSPLRIPAMETSCLRFKVQSPLPRGRLPQPRNCHEATTKEDCIKLLRPLTQARTPGDFTGALILDELD